MQMHYVHENKGAAETVVLLHGEPSWAYLFRHFITPLAKLGFEVVVPDFIGFGKSDKPIRTSHYSYPDFVDQFLHLLQHLNIQSTHLVVHDWGGLIGLRAVAQHPHMFRSVVAMNTAFPRAEAPNFVFLAWVAVSRFMVNLPLRFLLRGAMTAAAVKKVAAAYEAPFPSAAHRAGFAAMPHLVPLWPWQRECRINKRLWKQLAAFHRPFITLFSDRDPFTKHVEEQFIKHIKGCAGQAHQRFRGAGHFLMEDLPEPVVTAVCEFLKRQKE